MVNKIQNEPNNKPSQWQQLNKNNTAALGFWTLIWVLTMALANFGPKFIWDFNTLLTVIAIMINLAFGVKMIFANIKHLKGLDEMQQKIQLNAMGISLGLSLVVGLAYSNLEVNNLIGFHAEISHLVIFMGLSYLTATIIGTKNYK